MLVVSDACDGSECNRCAADSNSHGGRSNSYRMAMVLMRNGGEEEDDDTTDDQFMLRARTHIH